MFRSHLVEAALIGCLTALASFCALNAQAGETYSIVAQSNRSSAATGRRPLSERIAAANLPIISPTTATTAAAPPRATATQRESLPEQPAPSPENMAVAAVRVDHMHEGVPSPPVPKPAFALPVLWPFAPKWPVVSSQAEASSASKTATAKTATAKTATAKTATPKGTSAKQSTAQTQATGRDRQRQTTARSNGKDLNGTNPASVTR